MSTAPVATPPSARSTASRLAVLTSLYVAQGLPFGFFNQCIPVLMRQAGSSLVTISLTNLLALPWILKLVWAPLFNHPRLANPAARRVSVLCFQAAAVALLLVGTGLDPKTAALPVFTLVLLSNLISATQDIPTDAMTVEALEPSALGLGNGAQVAGYRLGMVIGGGWLLTVLDGYGWAAAVGVLALALVATTIPLLVSGPLRPARAVEPTPAPISPRSTPFFREPGMASWFAVLVVYKLGVSFGAGSLKPMLVDYGYSIGDIGWLVGTLGSGAAMLGSVAGGWLTTRIRHALPIFALLQAAALLLWVAVSLHPSGPGARDLLLVALVVEHATSGLATTSLFTEMMTRCRPGRAASDYTTQASTVLVAEGIAAIASGASAQWLGYPLHLALACVLAFSAVALTFRNVASTSTRT